MAVADDPDGLACSQGEILLIQPAVQQGVVRQDRSDARHDAHAGVPDPVDLPPGLLSCDPFGFAGPGGDLAIRRHSILHDHIGGPAGDVVEKDRVDGVAFLPHEVLDHFDARLPQDLRALARHQGIGIPGADDHPGDPVLHDGLRAGRRFAVVAAGLQGHVDGGAVGRLSERGDGVAFRMELPAFLMIAFADDLTVLDDHRPHHGVGVAPALASLCELDGPQHVSSVFRVHCLILGVPAIRPVRRIRTHRGV